MTDVSIDFSLNSPAVCIRTGGGYRFISFFNSDVKDWHTSKKFSVHREIEDFVTLVPYMRDIDKTDYQSEQRSKTKDATKLSVLVPHAFTHEAFDEGYRVAIEGFAYASQGSSGVDLVMYQSFLRNRLAEAFGFKCLFVVAPTEVKKKAGKGNYSKEQMFEAFKSNVLNDSLLLNNDFWLYCRERSFDKVPKPIDDLVDSYFILNTAFHNTDAYK